MHPVAHRNRTSQSGYTLGELALVLAIVSVVVGMSVSAGVTQLEIQRVSATKSNLATISTALTVYQKKHLRYPCPAEGDDIPTDTTYGFEVTAGCEAFCPAGLTCQNNAVIGTVPFKTLKINEEVAYDGWGRKITYAMDKNHALHSQYETGSVPIEDGNGYAVTDSSVMGDAIFVLVSHGEDGAGAWQKTSGTQLACTVGAKDEANCDGTDDIFVDMRPNNGDVAAQYFDDVVLWKSQENLDLEGDGETEELDYSKYITVGEKFSCGIKNDATLWCWGLNNNGQLGDAGVSGGQSLNPVQENSGSSWLAVSAGLAHACGIKNDSSLWCWGDNSHGQLGNGLVPDSNVPVAISAVGTWKAISSGWYFSCAVKSDDTIWCWGEGSGGQLGNGLSSDSGVPVQVTSPETWKSVASGSNHTCGLTTGGTAYCWGDNAAGQLGTGATGGTSPTPTLVAGSTIWDKLLSGGDAPCGIKNTDALVCWGYNNKGQVGDSSTSDRNTPTAVSGGGSWKAVKSGESGACGVRTNGTGWCWGLNATGQLGNNSTADSIVPITISGSGMWKTVQPGQHYTTATGYHTCGIKSDKTAWCWGDNDNGQVGDGFSGTNRLAPTAVTGGSTWGP